MAGAHQKNSRQKRDAIEVIITDLSSILEEMRHESGLDDCFSTREISDKLNIPVQAVRNIIKTCIANGICEYVGKRCETGIDGRLIKVPIYRFKFKNKNKGRKKKQ